MSLLPDIEKLAVNEIAILNRIASDLSIKTAQVSAVVTLTAEGCTVPFISRYRKERTGSLDEVQVRDCVHKFEGYKNLEERRIEVTKGIAALGKLDETLYENIVKASTLTELDDLWAPYKKKKKTRGMLAQEKGLTPLAEIMLSKEKADVDAAAPGFVRADAEHPELSVPGAREAIDGAKDIIAERVSQNIEMRAAVKDWYFKTGKLVTKGVGDEAAREKSTYQMYWDYSEPLLTLKSHRVLAVNRAERESALDVTIDVDEEGAARILKDKAWIHNDYHAEAIEDGLSRLLSPAVIREIRSDATEYSETHAIDVFSENLKNLLMSPPLRGSRILGVDPGIRTGTKCAALDETGKFLDYFVINQETKLEEAKKAIAASVKKHRIEIIAVGNGTASHEVQATVAASIEGKRPSTASSPAVDEDGASVYSASDIAREEFPDLDLTIRGAHLHRPSPPGPPGRTRQDRPQEHRRWPLPARRQPEKADRAAGRGRRLCRQPGGRQPQHREPRHPQVRVGHQHGARKKDRQVQGRQRRHHFSRHAHPDSRPRRKDLRAVCRLPQDPRKSQRARQHLGSPRKLRPGGGNPPVHQGRRRSLARAAGLLTRKILGGRPRPWTTSSSNSRNPTATRAKVCRPPYSRRASSTSPISREGMKVTGKVKNVVDFGAFVDIGIKESALIHISELSDQFVRDPMEAIKVGDVREFTIISLDEARHRIGLSLKTRENSAGEKSAQPKGGHAPRAEQSAQPAQGARRVLRVAARPASPGGASVAAPGGAPAVPSKTSAAPGPREAQRTEPRDPQTSAPTCLWAAAARSDRAAKRRARSPIQRREPASARTMA